MSAGLLVDLFAGGGGASLGIEAVFGRNVDIAINHDPVAVAVHTRNHPLTRHYTTDIWEVSPLDATKGHPVKLLHASPDCKHFSRAKGGKPREQGIRSLAWVVRRWAKDTRPEVITLENVPEFLDWGPLYAAGTWRNDTELKWRQRCPTCDWKPTYEPKEKPPARHAACAWKNISFTPIVARRGETFRRWRRDLEELGYVVEHRFLKACDYGAPTSRKRLFIVARRDGRPCGWPTATHGPGLLPYKTAAECIDWSIPCPSIFTRKKPLADKTLMRIAAGLKKFVFDNPTPFIVPVNHGGGESRAESLHEPLTTVTAARRGHALVSPYVVPMNADNPPMRVGAPLGTVTTQGNRFNLVAPTLIQTSYGERQGQAPRVLDLHQPLGTVVAQGQKHSLVAAFIAKHFGRGGSPGSSLANPLDTVTATDHNSLVEVALGRGDHRSDVRAFLTAYYGSGADVGQDVNDPLRTVVTRDRFGLVTVQGVDYEIVDIGMRMLEPHELLRAQFGRFAAAYDMRDAKTKKDAVRLIGNSVCPEVEEALIATNFPEELERRKAA